MKLHLLSDLHLEFASYEADTGALAAADVIVLAGDIHVGVEGIAWARRAFESKPIVYVCGNHEFYSGHWTATLEECVLLHGLTECSSLRTIRSSRSRLRNNRPR